MRRYGTLIVFVLAIGLMWVVSRCQKEGDIGLPRIRVDTVTVERVDTVWIERVETQTVDHWDTVYQDTVIYRDVPVLASRYIDSVALNNSMLHYNIAVIGDLYSTDFRLVSKVPQVTRTITNNITKEETREPGGLFITTSFGPLGLGVGVMYVKKRWAYGYEYGLNRTHSARVGLRVF